MDWRTIIVGTCPCNKDTVWHTCMCDAKVYQIYVDCQFSPLSKLLNCHSRDGVNVISANRIPIFWSQVIVIKTITLKKKSFNFLVAGIWNNFDFEMYSFIG